MTEFTSKPDQVRVIDPDNDPHLWLEEVTSEEALNWVRQRNSATEDQVHDGLYEQIRDELTTIYEADDRIPAITQRGDYVYNIWTDADQPQGLWRRTSVESFLTDDPQWETLLDLDALSAAEETTWVWHGARLLRPEQTPDRPEWGYRRALIDLSEGGSDADVTREFDLETKTFIPAEDGGFFRPAGKGSLSWITAEAVFCSSEHDLTADDLTEHELTEKPATTTSGYPRTVRYWQRGTPLTEADVVLSVDPDEMVVAVGYDSTIGYERFVGVQQKDFYHGTTYLIDPESSWSRQRIDVADDVTVGFHRDLILFSPRTDTEIAATPCRAGGLYTALVEDFLAGKPGVEALFTPDEHQALSTFTATRYFLLLTVMEDVVEHTLAFWRESGNQWRQQRVFSEVTGTLSVMAADAATSNEIWLNAENFLNPSTLYRGSLEPLLQEMPEQLDIVKTTPERFVAEGMAALQRFTISDDGTRIPYFLLGRADIVQAAAEGQPSETIAGGQSAPTILYGYGGFRISMNPQYMAHIGKSWLERGGVFAIANIRGGGEYGPDWHTQALCENRHRAYEDFAAVARDLVATGVTTVEQLACRGGSNGGLLTGNMLTQYPELFGAVVIEVPLLDMKRFAQLLAGASWRAEYGDPDTEDWEFIQTFSPYHLLRKDVEYPRVLLTTSTRDDRVHPAHARKMTAALESIGADVSYWENIEGGHSGAANSEQRAMMGATVFRYLLAELSR